MAFVSSHEIAAQAGEPHSIIRVTNLQASLKVGTDAWGRSGRTQPVLISASISLRQPFATATATDTVDDSTLHYGKISKSILDAVDTFEASNSAEHVKGSLMLFWNHIAINLTGVHSRVLTFGLNSKETRTPAQEATGKKVQSLELKITLPKASLVGTGVSFYGTLLFEENGQLRCQTRGLKLHDLSIQTLVGVNPNERLARQIVRAIIDLNLWDGEEDIYVHLEQIVVKTIEESSFETLEALASHTAARVVDLFIAPSIVHLISSRSDYRVRVCLEKPTAVTFADAPAVEVLVDAAGFGKGRGIRPPFPLQGRLDAWVESVDAI